MGTSLTQEQADTIAKELDLDLNAVCHACLSFVSFALDRGDRREVSRQLRRVTPDLWHEGLADHALAAVKSAVELGLPGSREALIELEARQGAGVVARAIVRQLAVDLSRRTRTEMSLESFARDRLGRSPPELN